jgi:ERCC4-type nuclease
VVIDSREEEAMVDALASWGAIVERQRPLQVGALRTTERWAYLIVEGARVDSGPLDRPQIRGALLRLLEHGVRVIRTESREDSACWMALLAVTEQRHQRRWRPHRVP